MIGAKTAARIIAWREAHGGIRTVDDLRMVKGIGRKKLSRLRDKVRVSPPADEAPDT